MVKFIFNSKKCVLPYNPEENRPTKCLKCLEACPNSLLMFRPLKDKDKNGAPINYEIYLEFKSYADKFCPECLKCVNVCPENALTINF